MTLGILAEAPSACSRAHRSGAAQHSRAIHATHRDAAPDRFAELLNVAAEIELESASTTNGHLGYVSRLLTVATMPHRKPTQCVFVRRNGHFSLSMLSPPHVGLPYGTKPRLLMAWLAREVAATEKRELVLGESLAEFMRQLGLSSRGGKRGDIAMLKEQMRRLFACSITFVDERPERFHAEPGRAIVDATNLWWKPAQPDQCALWASTVTLSEWFFGELMAHPVPVDLRLLRTFQHSAMELDIYGWLTHKASYTMRATRPIPWDLLRLQFGADYADTKAGLRAFRFNFLKHLKVVLSAYRGAKVELSEKGLIFKPSLTSVPRVAASDGRAVGKAVD